MTGRHARLIRPTALLILALACLWGQSDGSGHRPDLAVFARSVEGEAPPPWLIERIREDLRDSDRFVVLGPESTGIADDSALVDPASLSALSADLALDSYVAIGVRPVRTRELTAYESDTLARYDEVSLTVAAWFYTGGGTLLGTVEETSTRIFPDGSEPSLDRMMESAARRIVSEALMSVFPVEIHFTASSGALQTIPAGSELGLRKGMALSVVASSIGFPESPEQYEMLRTHGILQVMDVEDGTSSGRLLAGTMVPGGDVIAIEQSSPVSISLSYRASPVSVTPGEELTSPEDLDESRLLNSIGVDVQTCKWGLNVGGTAFFGVSSHLSTLGLCFQGGPRIPLATPDLALRLSGGVDVSFLMQEVRNVLLSSNANAITVGGVADASIEWLASDHFGLRMSAAGYLGTSVESWNVTDRYGNPRDAEPDEVYFTRLERSPLSFGAGLFYLIY